MSILNKQLKIFAISKSLFGVFVIVALSLFATGFVYSANTYYDIDANGGAGEIVVNHNQSINGITELGDGGTANYAQFSATGNLLFTGSANQISKTDGALTITTTAQDLTISTTTTGNLAITSAGNITETIAEGSTYTLTDGSVNFLKVTSTRDIEVGATLVSGSFEFTEDSGLSTLVDMPVSATAATAQGYVFKIDGDNIMTIYSTADGSGGIENKRIGIGTTAPGGLLELEKSYAGGATARTWSIVDGDIATTDQTADMIGLDINLSTGAVDLAGSANAYGLKVDVDGIDDQSSGGAYAAAFMGGNVGIGILTPSVALHVAGQCVTADTRLRRRRKKKAGEIADEEAGEWEDSEYVYDQVMIKDIQPGDEIASMNPITGELVYSQVEGLMNMGQKVVYKLVTQSGREIKTTENHPYFVRTKYEEPIARPNQKLVKFEVDQSIKIEEFNKDSVVAIANKENSFAVVVPRKVKQTLRDTLRKNQTQKFNAVVFATAIVKAIDKIDAIVNELAIDMEYVGYEKVIANVIAKVFPQIQINFTQVGKKSPAHFVAYKVYKKEKTADYIADINDIVSQTKNALRWSFLPNPQGAESPDTPRTLLITNSLDDNKKLVKGGVWAKVKGLKVGQMIAVTHGDKVVWERIMEIKQLPIEKVYDIEVQGTHNFVANDIIAHNTYLGSDLTIYEDANDADVRLNMGTSATERVSIQSLNATGTKTLEQVLFQTDTASATADYGKFRFNVDGTDILQIDDDGIEMLSSKILTGNVTGDLTGNVTGDITGNVTGDVSGSSGSCTGNSATVTNGVYTTNNLSVMSATTSAQLAGVISDETGTDKLVYSNSPILITPALGTPTALVGTNITGTASNLTAGLVSTITGLAPDTATTQASQPNITSLGTLASLTMGGNITMGSNSITGINTLGSAGLATLDSLSVTNNATVGGTLTVTGTTTLTGGVGLGADLDGNGNYAVDLQNIGDGHSDGAGYRFDGEDDYVNCGSGESLIFTHNDSFTIALWEYALNTNRGHMYQQTDTGYMRLTIPADGDYVLWDVGAFNGHTSGGTNPSENQWNHIVVMYDASNTELRTYLNGVFNSSKSVSNANFTTSGYNFLIGRASSRWMDGSIDGVKIYNRALTATEIKQAYSGVALDYADIGADNVEQTSGTLTIGKRYRIKNWITDDDFTNIGASSNATGIEFVATGTTPTHWAHSSVLVQIGAVLNLDKDGMTESKWFDKSGNGNDGAVVGATLINREIHPKIVGGDGVTDTISIQGTTANGTASAIAIKMLVGNNGDIEAMTILNDGKVNINTGDLTVSGDLTISGDDLTMLTNTVGYLLVADGTNYNPVLMSGNASIGSDGAVTVNDLTCTNCINATEIEDIYLMNSVADALTASVDTSTLLTIQNTDTTIGTAGYLLELIHDANDDADADFLICQDDGNGTPDTLFSIASDGTLKMANDVWLSASDNAGTGTINMMKVNSSDAIEVGGTLVSGSFEFTEDSGLATLVEMPVSATPIAGTAEGYVFKIDGDNIMTIYAEADHLGGIQDKGVGIGITTPSRRLDVLDTTANIPQLRLTHDNTTYGEFYIDATGDLSISLTDSADGDDIRILNENLWVCSGGTFASPACPSVSLSDVGNLVVEGKIYENTTALEDKYVMAASAGAADYPCYGHYGCHAATNYTTCYVDPNNPDNASCWTNDTLASLTKAAESVSCGSEMAKIIDTKYGAGVFCIDRWEAYDAGANTAGSVRNQTAKISISQTDAATFCTNAGKHLCTSQEWLSACNYGSYNFATIDDHGGTATAPCNTGSSAKIPTGTYNHCHTTDWVYDMVGNVWEWTDAGLTVDNPDASWSAGHSSSGDGIGYYTDDDGYWFSTNTGRAFIRGGAWGNGDLNGCFTVSLTYAPESTDTSIGFRCCQ